MHPIMKTHKVSIKTYCEKNGLSVDEVYRSAQSGNSQRVFLYRPNPVKLGGMFRDETPAPIVLKIFLEDGKLRFEQTDITHKYLGVVETVASRTVAKPIIRPSIPTRPKLAYA